MLRRFLLSCLVATSGLGVASCSQAAGGVDTGTAQDQLATDPESHAAPPGPPPEVFSACDQLEAGAPCSVTFVERQLGGTCRKGPDGQGELACAPSNMRPPPPQRGDRPHGPPPEAFDACKSLAEGVACAVTLGDKTLEGACRKGPDGQGELACAPSNMPPPPPPRRDRPQGPPPEALDACKSLAEGGDCSVTLPRRTSAGVCRKAPDGQGELACVPANMPPPPPPPSGQ